MALGKNTRANYFNPRSPCGERQALRPVNRERIEFQSTLSLRRATPRCNSGAGDQGISIHALLAESDVEDYPEYAYCL